MKKFVALVVVFCAMMISSTSSAAETIEELFERYTGWRCIYSDDNYAIHIYTKSIRRDYNYRGYVFRAFVKWIYRDAGRQRKIETLRSGGVVPCGMYNLSYDVDLEYFKEEDGMKYFCIMNNVSYDENGYVISELGYSKDVLKWQIVTPDSIGEWIFDMVQARVPN